MLILGIDPGVTVGWCVYDTEKRCVGPSGNVEWDDTMATRWWPWTADEFDATAIERPVGQGPTRPTMVDCGIVAGQLFVLARGSSHERPKWVKRTDVRKALTTAIFGAWTVTNDATAWAALLEMHGGAEAGKKGGPLHGPVKHAKAALATAVAYHLISTHR